MFVSYIGNLQDGRPYFKISDVHIDGKQVKEEVIEFLREREIDCLLISYLNNLSSTDTEFLKCLPWLKRITIIKSDIDLSGLNFVSNIEELIIEVNNSFPFDFSNLKKLRLLDIKWTRDRAGFAECHSLHSLYLKNFNQANLGEISQLKVLKSLTLVKSTITSLESIDEMNNLERLSIGYCSKLEEFQLLSRCWQIKDLEMFNLPKLTTLEFMKNMKLEKLSIEDCKNIVNNSSIFNISSLRYLSYIKSGSFSTLKPIEGLPNLIGFVFGSTPIADGDIKPLLKLKNLKNVYYADNEGFNMKLFSLRDKLLSVP